MGLLLPAFGRPGAWKRLLAVGGLLVAVAVLITGSPTPAAAGVRVIPSRVAARVGSGDVPRAEAGDVPLTAPDAITALGIARLENAPVEVMSERTETTSVFALPGWRHVRWPRWPQEQRMWPGRRAKRSYEQFLGRRARRGTSCVTRETP